MNYKDTTLMENMKNNNGKYIDKIGAIYHPFSPKNYDLFNIITHRTTFISSGVYLLLRKNSIYSGSVTSFLLV